MKDNGGGPPILRIKKDADRDVVFHGAGKESSRPGFEPRERVPRGDLRRSRNTVLLLVNLALIMVLVLVYRSRQTVGALELDGYRFTPTASVAGDEVFLAVEVRRMPGKTAAGGGERFFVKATLLGSGNELLMSEALPEDSTVVRGRTAYGGETAVVIQLTIGKETVTRTSPLSRPAAPKR